MSKIRELHGRKDKKEKTDNWAACRLEEKYMGMIQILERNKIGWEMKNMISQYFG